jgi:RNA polymerase sigma-70 factor (ECF subfamily)
MPDQARPRARTGNPCLVETNRELEAFLRNIAPRAFRIARFSLRDDADARDAVQEAMIRLARSYGGRPANEWPPLFYAILRNCVHDEQRGKQSRGRLITWFKRMSGGDEVALAIDQRASAAQEIESEQRLRQLERAIALLPERQREAFLLRNVEELDVAATAKAMGCSEGSVKTHYSRAVHALRDLLGEP